MADGQFSGCALALLRHHLSGYSLMMGASNPESLPGYTEQETRAAYAELVAAELMIAIDTLAQERGARFWLTLAAIERKAELLGVVPTSRRASP